MDNLKIDLDLKRHLPDTLEDYLEFKLIANAENLEFNFVWDKMIEIFKNSFILEADENGIERFEKIVKIPQRGNLENRRNMVLFQWNKINIHSMPALINFLDLTVGKGNYKVTLKGDEYFILFQIYPNKSAYTEMEIKKMLREILPANLVVEVRIIVHSYLVISTKYAEYQYPFPFCGEYNCGEYY